MTSKKCTATQHNKLSKATFIIQRFSFPRTKLMTVQCVARVQENYENYNLTVTDHISTRFAHY